MKICRGIHAKLADPIKASDLMNNIDGCRETLGRARAAWKQANDLAASNQDVLPPDLAACLRQAGDDLCHRSGKQGV